MHTQPAASADQVLQLAVQHPHASPAHERAEQVHVVRRCQLSLHLRTDPGLVPSVDEQCAGGQGDLRPWWELDRRRGGTELGQGQEEIAGVRDQVIGTDRFRRELSDGPRDLVRQVDLANQRLWTVAAGGAKHPADQRAIWRASTS